MLLKAYSAAVLLLSLGGCRTDWGISTTFTPAPQADEIRRAGVEVWAAGSTEKIEAHRRSALRHDGVFDVAKRTIRLRAVRGEHAPFHLVVTTTRDAVPDVRVELSPLRGASHTLTTSHIHPFYEYLVDVYAPTGAHGRAAKWPDPLVPLTTPFTVPAPDDDVPCRHQPIWIDVFVPRDQAAGVYSGTVTVRSAKRVIGVVQIELTVVNITLPANRSFPAHVGFYEHHIARMHGVKVDSDEFRRLFKRYLQFFLDNRIDPRTGPGMHGRLVDGEYKLDWPRPDLEKLFLDGGRLRIYVSPVPHGVDRQAGDVPFTERYADLIRSHVRQVLAHARAKGWYARLGFWIPVDEPKSAGQYAAVRRWADAVREVDAEVAVAVTEQPFTENPEWGTLAGHVNTWVINGNYLFTGEAAIDTRRRAGDRMIWYISCDQLYPQPNYYIDREAADLRMVPWLTWRYRMSGILYWTASFWEEVRNPWLDPITWKWFPCNSPAAGEGSLVYPGNMAKRYTGQDDVDGPVGSLRLALLREGLEELELLALLGRLDRAAADRIVGSICRHVRDFSRDPNVIDSARDALINALLAAATRVGNGR